MQRYGGSEGCIGRADVPGSLVRRYARRQILERGELRLPRSQIWRLNMKHRSTLSLVQCNLERQEHWLSDPEREELKPLYLLAYQGPQLYLFTYLFIVPNGLRTSGSCISTKVLIDCICPNLIYMERRFRESTMSMAHDGTTSTKSVH